MSIMFMNYLDCEIADLLKAFIRTEKIISYDAFSGKLVKLAALCKHYRGLLHKRKIVNVLQSGTRWMDKRIAGIVGGEIINVFLYHGWGVKRSPGNLEAFNKSQCQYWRRLRENIDFVICYSEFDKSYFLRHPVLEDLPMPSFYPLGHPRNDFLCANLESKSFTEKIKKELEIPSWCKVILFAPTHRETYYLSNNDYDAKILQIYHSELSKVDHYLTKKNIVILFRPHYFTEALDGWKFKNIKITTQNKFRDPRPLMLASDLLITDYSSIYVDYLLLKKPIVFYQPDLEYYQYIRGLVVDPKNPVHMPGPKINQLSDVLEVDEKEFAKYDLNASRAFFHKYHDNKATERLAKFLIDVLDK